MIWAHKAAAFPPPLAPNKPEIKIIHRFPNEPLSTANGLRWDINKIFDGVGFGLRACPPRAEGIASIAVDGWAVDYAHSIPRRSGALPFCIAIREQKNPKSKCTAFSRPARLYSLTGIQILRSTRSTSSTPINSPARSALALAESTRIHHLPPLRKRVSEYTNATHTALVALRNTSLVRRNISKTRIGNFRRARNRSQRNNPRAGRYDLAKLPEFRDTKIIVPACHELPRRSPQFPRPVTTAHSSAAERGPWSARSSTLHVSPPKLRAQLHESRWRGRKNLLPEKRKRHVAPPAVHRRMAAARQSVVATGVDLALRFIARGRRIDQC